jgi:NADH-quinone oxidoreductase subunit N
MIVVAAALVVLLVDALLRDSKTSARVLPWLSLLAFLLAGVASVWLGWPGSQPQAFQDMAVADSYALTFNVVVLTAAALGVLLAKDSLVQISSQQGSYYALLLLAVSGMMTMGAALDLIVVFLALEILSLALYILVGFNRAEPRSAEASLKYFLLGAFASGFFLYGVALLYAATGTTNLQEISEALAGGSQNMLFLYGGTALLIAGFGFKVALVPFHMWTPDAYQGAPTPVTGFMSVATKAAAFAALIRVFLGALPASYEVWGWALAILAALTMTLGNLAALRQLSLKRLLAYSSIAHAGYALVGLVPGTAAGASAVLFYLFVYAFMNLGAFAVVLSLERLGENDVLQGQFAGLSERRPLLAAAMAIFMFSLAGMPPFAGFFAKFYVFSTALEGGWGWLVLIGVVNSVISAYYYLRVTVEMYFAKPEAEQAPRGGKTTLDADGAPALLASPQRTISVAVLIGALATVVIGLWPYPWTQWIGQAVQSVFGG